VVEKEIKRIKDILAEKYEEGQPPPQPYSPKSQGYSLREGLGYGYFY
jgi:hypothetical protein